MNLHCGNAMEYTFRVSDSGRYIHITVRGAIDRHTAAAMNVEAHALGRSLAIHNYLVDLVEAVNIDSVIGNYQFAYENMQAPDLLDADARVATLVGQDDHSHDFVETVSRNAGFDVTFFRDREAAIHHVDSDPGATPA
jgi:hypothetical protein